MSLIKRILKFIIVIVCCLLGNSEFTPKIIKEDTDETKLKMIVQIDDKEKELRLKKYYCVPTNESNVEINTLSQSIYYIGHVVGEVDSLVAIKYDGLFNGYIKYKNNTYVIKSILTEDETPTMEYVITLSDKDTDNGIDITCEATSNNKNPIKRYRNIRGLKKHKKNDRIRILLSVSIPCGKGGPNVDMSDEKTKVSDSLISETEESSKYCGNGVVDEDEDCDCGSEMDCLSYGENRCCDPDSCKIRPDCDCVSGPCCGFDGNFLRDVICSVGDGICSEDSRCNGSSSECPHNYKPTGTTCPQQGACYDGKCVTRESECESLWGPWARTTWQDVNSCYDINLEGTIYGNCGIRTINDFSYNRCYGDGRFCGKLFCNYVGLTPAYNGSLELVHRGNNCWVTIPRHRGYLIVGMVPDYLRCGDNDYGYCYNHDCYIRIDYMKFKNNEGFKSENEHKNIKNKCNEPFVLDKNGMCVHKTEKHHIKSITLVLSVIGMTSILFILFFTVLMFKRKSYKCISDV